MSSSKPPVKVGSWNQPYYPTPPHLESETSDNYDYSGRYVLLVIVGIGLITIGLYVGSILLFLSVIGIIPLIFGLYKIRSSRDIKKHNNF